MENKTENTIAISIPNLNTSAIKQRTRYKKVSKGVYQYIKNSNKPGNKYRVLKIVNGRKIENYFTSKARAIKFYKSL